VRAGPIVRRTGSGAPVSEPVELPEEIVGRVRALCPALPEVTVRVDYSLTRARSTAHSFDIRRRSFCLLVAREDPAGKSVPLLVLRADPDDREALLSVGHPFFAPRVGRDRVGVLLTEDTDWEEIRELMTESYRARAEEAHRVAGLAALAVECAAAANMATRPEPGHRYALSCEMPWAIARIRSSRRPAWRSRIRGVDELGLRAIRPWEGGHTAMRRLTRDRRLRQIPALGGHRRSAGRRSHK
jgi:hypothetical protein